MHTCVLLNAFSAARGKTVASRGVGDGVALYVVRRAPAFFARLSGAAALLSLLLAIPRSNDDFSLF